MVAVCCSCSAELIITKFKSYFIMVKEKKKKLLSVARITMYIFSKRGVNGWYFLMSLSSFWNSAALSPLISVIPVDKISIPSSNSLFATWAEKWEKCEMILVSWCSLPLWWWWNSSKAIQLLQIPGREKAFYSWHRGPCANTTAITTETPRSDHWSLETY